MSADDPSNTIDAAIQVEHPLLSDDAALEPLQAAAFRALCRHLQQHSAEVSNMDIMTVAGFCRNCLAKWMVLEARRLVDDSASSLTIEQVNAYNTFGYEEAAQSVYGTTYSDWKQRYQKTSTKEQLELYAASTPLHAQHDPELLLTRAAVEINDDEIHNTATTEKPPPSWAIPSPTPASSTKTNIASDVCCVDVDDDIRETAVASTLPPALTRDDITAPSSYIPPPIPDLTSFRNAQFPVTAIVTVSDRAYAGIYVDEGGPAVAHAMRALPGVPDDLDFVWVLVPDDAAAICAKLRTLADQGVDLILTTGGTGFAARDVTPEATADVVDYELPSVMAFCMTRPDQNPLSTLSRGTVGILQQTVIGNLPGNPAAVAEVLPLLLPLVLHAVAELQNVTPEILHIG